MLGQLPDMETYTFPCIPYILIYFKFLLNKKFTCMLLFCKFPVLKDNGCIS